jgi:hypothetical protein
MSGFFEEDRNLSPALNKTPISVFSRPFPRHYTDSAYPIECSALGIDKGFYFVTTYALAFGSNKSLAQTQQTPPSEEIRTPNLEMISHFLLVWRFINHGAMILLLIEPYRLVLRDRKCSVFFIYLLGKIQLDIKSR